MKSIIIQYENVEEYSAAYKDFVVRGIEIMVVMDMGLALMIKSKEIAWLTIVGYNEFEKDTNSESGMARMARIKQHIQSLNISK